MKISLKVESPYTTDDKREIEVDLSSNERLRSIARLLSEGPSHEVAWESVTLGGYGGLKVTYTRAD